MKVPETIKAISGRKVADGENRPRPFVGRVLYEGGPPETTKLGEMEDIVAPAQNWDAAARAWTQSPPPTVEERVAKLEGNER